MVTEMFPEYSTGLDAFQKPHMNIYQVFFTFESDIDGLIQAKDQESVAKIFKFTEWCFDQRKRNHDIWNAAATAFLEHLADKDERAEIIPFWIKPEIFLDMKSEFKKRRERDGKGKFQTLVEKYNQINNTNFE
ncbi:MAG TPA: hypothetical protein VFQ23_25105 [Anaerolineales bacterium]|nr:hypothetical protein [Anaerolineales bacterium]